MALLHRAFVVLLTLATLIAAVPRVAAQEATDEPAPDNSSELTTQLPAADLPTMNEQGYVFEITSSFTGSLDAIPTSAPVFNMIASTYDATQAQQIADQLGVGQPVTDNGGGSFTATGNGQLFVSPGLVQFISNAAVTEGPLPGDTEAVASAREWLRQAALLPADTGEGRIEAKVATPPRVIVTFRPVQPAPLLSSIPGISVTLGPNGAVLEASVRWASVSVGDTYQLTPGVNAWGDVEGRRSYVNVNLPADLFPAGATVRGTAIYTSAVITYTSSGIPGEQQYLQPVIAFSGTLTPEGQSATYGITAYVPALINSNQPVG